MDKIIIKRENMQWVDPLIWWWCKYLVQNTYLRCKRRFANLIKFSRCSSNREGATDVYSASIYLFIFIFYYYFFPHFDIVYKEYFLWMSFRIFVINGPVFFFCFFFLDQFFYQLKALRNVIPSMFNESHLEFQYRILMNATVRENPCSEFNHPKGLS